MTRKQLKTREYEAWITRESQGEEYTTPAGRKLRRRTRQAMYAGINKKDFERAVKSGAIGIDDVFIVEWQCRIDNETKRFSQRSNASGWEGFLEARTLRNEIQPKLNSGEFEAEWKAANAPKEAPPPVYTLAMAIDEYERDRTKIEKATTSVAIARTLTRFRGVVGDNVPLAEITTQHIDRFSNEIQTKYSVGIVSVNAHLRYVREFFNTMYEWRKIPFQVKVTQYPEPTPDKPIITTEQHELLMEQTGAAELPMFTSYPRWLWWRTALQFYYETGIRRNELLTLRWEDVDFARRIVWIRSNNTKTKKTRPACFQELSALLLVQLREHATSDSIPAELQGFIFPWNKPNEDGSGLNAQFERIWHASGMEWIDGIGFHAYRRACGTHLAATKGVTVAQHHLGHTSPAVTMRNYGHHAIPTIAASGEMPVSDKLKSIIASNEPKN